MAGTIFTKCWTRTRALSGRFVILYSHNEQDHELYQGKHHSTVEIIFILQGWSKVQHRMYRIALNTAISDIRKQSRKVELSFPEFYPGKKPMRWCSQRRTDQTNVQCHCPAEWSGKAIGCYTLEDKSYDEMERDLGISNRHCRWKWIVSKKIKNHLTKEEGMNLINSNPSGKNHDGCVQNFSEELEKCYGYENQKSDCKNEKFILGNDFGSKLSAQLSLLF